MGLLRRLAALAVGVVGLGTQVGCIPELIRLTNGLPAYTARPAGWTEEWVAMRDGVRLKTFVLLPEGAKQAPVYLTRNPYPVLDLLKLQCEVYVRYGIGCVIQEVRGRLESEGIFNPVLQEVADGADAMTWLDRQPWAESVALGGISYLGATALAAAGDPSPKLKALVVTVFGSRLQGVVYEQGLFMHELLTAWASYMPSREPPPDVAAAYQRALVTLPHQAADSESFGGHVPWYREFLTAALPTARIWNLEETKAFGAVPEKIHVPVLIIEGFDDPFLPAALHTFPRLASRNESLMVILPVAHNGDQTGDVQMDGTQGLFTFKLAVPWLRHHLLGTPLPYAVGGVQTWARGDTGPHTWPEWPPATLEEKWVLSSLDGPGRPCPQRLLRTEAEQGPPATLNYRYDPAHPWMSEGGARGLAFAVIDHGGVRPGPVVQTWECRQDVLRFVAAASPTSKRLMGRMHLSLQVRSSAPDTAFVAKLVDIDEHDRAVHITDAGATLQLPTAQAQTLVPYTPGAERTVTLDFFPTEWVLRPGHRLGLWVSSSSFPMFSRHLNTAKLWYLEDSPQLADQTLEVGGSAPSVLTLREQRP